MLNEQYTLIPLRDLVVFPHMIVPVFVGRQKSINALEVAGETDKKIFLTLQKDPSTDDPGKNDLFEIGVVADILQVLKLPDGTVKVLVEGIKRGRILSIQEDPQCHFVMVEPIPDMPVERSISPATRDTLLKTFEEYVTATKRVATEVQSSIAKVTDLPRLSFMVAANIHLKTTVLQEVLEQVDPVIRTEFLIEQIHTELEVVRIDDKIKQRVKKQMSKAQREYYLNEQMKAIQKEMGKEDDFQQELEELKEKIENAKMPEPVKEKAEKELKKLRSMSPMSAESTVVRNYLDWIVSLPWGTLTADDLNVQAAEARLNRDHYGLEKPKERILEFLAVRQLAEDLKGPIICFVGPPGVGKTSLARSIAESMGKKFVRMSLGGVRDEAEIRGHRKTYIGALPGKLIQHMKKAGSMNPVFLLDEIDKMGSDFRGDPSAALLEALDPEQNKTFMDHYLEVEFDLSKVFFITTANTVDTIPIPLRDRMEIIRVPGYTEAEKAAIARNYLIPKQLKEHNLDDERVKITDTAVREVIQYYTREAGVRNLEREIGSLVRKAAKKLVTEERTKKVRINDKNVEKFLGQRRVRKGGVYADREIGVATGLAWTPYGGDLLQIEVAVFEGNGKLTVTGKLGDVMQESTKIAHTVVKSRATAYDIPALKFRNYDIHLHVPEGAVPKDGPSAGITMTTAILSALSDLEVNCKIAMTGEITLRGKVLPVGGIKEKVLAAHRAGIYEVIIPEDNEKDLTDIPSDVRNEIRFHLVGNIDQVLERVLILKERG